MQSTLASRFDRDQQFETPFIIADAGVNHEGSLVVAKRLIEEAAEAGAHAIKFQSYRAETIACKDSPAYWDLSKEPTRTQYDLFKKYDSFWKKEFEELATCCQAYNIEFLSTPFDLESAKFLNDLMGVFKISSSDLNNRPFIDSICSYNKPILLSTGASTLPEIKRSVKWVSLHGNQIALMHCVLNYPTADSDANLGAIQTLKEQFPNLTIGYSDHTLPGDMTNLLTATLLGAQIIEKHFTHDKGLPGNDHYHAMNLEDLRVYWKRLLELRQLVGSGEIRIDKTQEEARKYARRSLVTAKAIARGTKIEYQDLTWKRPGTGIEPSEIQEVIGKIAKIDIPEDTLLAWGDLS